MQQRSQKFSSSSDSSASPTPPGGHSPPQHTNNRPELKAELKPLFTHAPLSLSDREKNPSPPPRRRKKQEPTTPAFSFNPLQSKIPSGRQEPPVQTPVSHYGQPTPTPTIDEFPNWLPDEADDQLPSGTLALPLPTPSKRPRTQNGSDGSTQPSSYPASYLRYADHYESQSSGGSSSSPTISYGSSSQPHYGLDTDHHHMHPGPTSQYYGSNSADYPQNRIAPDVYGTSRDTGYHQAQGGAWQYYPPSGYRDQSF